MATAEYAIDIAAQLTGDETIAELDELTSELMGAGKQAEFFQSALQRVSRDLAAAGAASRSANDALAAGEERYRALESEANQAAKTVEKLGLKGDTMSRAYLEAARTSAQATAALDDQKSTLVGLERAAGAAEAREAKLSDTMRGVTKLSSHVDSSLTEQAKNWRVLGGVLGQLPGPLGGVGRAFAAGEGAEARFASQFGASAATAVKAGLALAGVTAAVVALTAAVAVGAVKIAVWAVSLADANRNADLAVEAIQAMHPELAGLDSTIAAVSKKTGAHADELNELGASLLGAGAKAESMAKSLDVAATAEAALGKGGSQQYLELIKNASAAQKAVDDAAKKAGGAVSKELTDKLNEANSAVDDFEYKTTTKLGGVVARQMQGLGAQSARLESNLSGLFGGLDIDPVLAGIGKLVDLFDKNSEAGRALKLIFDSVFQPLIDTAGTAATAIEAFYLGVLIGAVKLYIAIKPTIKAIEEFLGLDDDTLSVNFATLTKIGEALAPVFLAIAAVVGGTLVAAFVAIGAIVAAQVAVWYAFIHMIGIVVDFVVSAGTTIYNAVVEPFRAISDFLSGEIDFATLVNRLIMNVINTITGLGGAVLSAFVSLMAAPIDYVTGLDLSGMGRNLIMGFVRGITGALGAVVSAVTNVMGSAISAAKGVLGIHSPSKVFEDDVAGNTVDGFVGGVEAGTGDAQDAMSQMLAVPPANDVTADPAAALKNAQLSGDVSAIESLQVQPSSADGGGKAPPPPGSGDGASGGKGVSFGAGTTFNFYGVADAEQAQEAFQEMLDAAIEGDAAKLGAATKKKAA